MNYSFRWFKGHLNYFEGWLFFFFFFLYRLHGSPIIWFQERSLTFEFSLTIKANEYHYVAYVCKLYTYQMGPLERMGVSHRIICLFTKAVVLLFIRLQIEHEIKTIERAENPTRWWNRDAAYVDTRISLSFPMA